MKIHAIYFSATGGTRKVIDAIVRGIKDTDEFTGAEVCIHDFTLPQGRETIPHISSSDIAVVGTPVYAGRVPNLLLKYIQTLKGGQCRAIAAVTYGNRNFDDALIELHDLLKECNFQPIAAGAFVAQHSFSNILAARRPNAEDLEQAYNLGQNSAKKRSTENLSQKEDGINPLSIPGHSSAERKYYQPKDSDGNPIDIRKVKPKTSEKCNRCGLCTRICPMGAIEKSNPEAVTGICIKYNACIKECMTGAKYFDDPGYLYHKHDLEHKYRDNKQTPKVYM